MNSVVGKLSVNDFRLWAHHGWYEEERLIGAEYRIDVEMSVKIPTDGIELDDIIDYQGVVNTIRETMKNEYTLIEQSGLAIFQALTSRYGKAKDLKVTVTKLDLPINNLKSTSFCITA